MEAIDHENHSMTAPAQSSTALFPNRFAAPRQGRQPLLRQRLLEQLERAQNQKLILVCAAAGYGKTTLLQQYYQRCRHAGRSALWVTLHAGDNDLQRFIDLLGGALRSAHRTSLPDNHFTLDQVIALYHLPASPRLIVLDALEVIDAPTPFACLQWILDNLPAGTTLLIGSRTLPPLDLTPLRARGQLLEIGTDALRLSLEESTWFVRDSRQLALCDHEVDRLHRHSEGWITALYLACLPQGEGLENLPSLSSTDPRLVQYLAEDILRTLDETTLLFLLQTSVASTLCASLCDTLTGRDDSAQILGKLLRDNLFLHPVDDQPLQLRYHNLFAAYLRDTLQRRFPGRADTLRQAAARWHLDAGQPACAIDYLLDANAIPEAVDLLAEHIERFLENGRTRRLLRWLDCIPIELLDAHPRLNLAYGWALLFARRFKDALRLIAHLEEQGQHLQSQTLQCQWLSMTDQSEACCRLALAHLRQLPAEERCQARVVASTLALQLNACGHVELARDVLTQAPAPLACGVRQSIDSVLELTRGRLDAALQRLQTPTAQIGNVGTARLTYNAIGALLKYERGELAQAEGLLMPVLSQAREASTPDTLIICHVLTARLALRRGDRDTWLRHLVQLEHIGRQAGSQRIQCSAWLEHARVATLDKRLEYAEHAMRCVQQLSDWDRPGILLHANDVDCPLIAGQRLCIAQGAYNAAAKTLQAAIETARAHRHGRRQIKLQLLLAMARDGQKRNRLAIHALDQALQLACPEGFLQSFIEEGERLATLLVRWLERRQPPGESQPDSEKAFVIGVLRHLGRAADAGTRDANTSPALTSREVQVLQLLAVGHRNPVIAEKMFLSECTVKSHLRKINIKLGTRNRIQALAIARDHGWLD
ncbi:HTH-type transcriptional regulator MalT [compost metagenome]